MLNNQVIIYETFFFLMLKYLVKKILIEFYKIFSTSIFMNIMKHQLNSFRENGLMDIIIKKIIYSHLLLKINKQELENEKC